MGTEGLQAEEAPADRIIEKPWKTKKIVSNAAPFPPKDPVTTAQTRKIDPKAWPEPQVLEKWLMLTTKDTDPSAMFLRKMLNMNPAYGAYLTSNEDLAELVMMSAKRVRTKMSADSGLVTQTALFEPLCDMAWRIVGHIFHSIINLQESQHLPVPQMALGQIKMLIQTNEDLSQQLKESRRAYLRELTFLREKTRTISAKAQRAVDSLQDEPVIFYEPLSYVLDDTTKAFVCEIVEERMKNELRTNITAEKEEVEEEDTKDWQGDINKLKDAMQSLRSEVARNAERAKRAEAELARTKEELKETKLLLARRAADLEALQKERDALQKDLERVEGDMADRIKAEGNASQGVDATIAELREALQAEKQKVKLLRRLEDQIEEQRNKIEELEEALRIERSKPPIVETKIEEKIQKSTTSDAEIAELERMRKLSKQNEQTEKDLRKQIAKLEQALALAEENARKAGQAKKAVTDIPQEEPEPVVKVKKSKGYTEAELQDALDKAAAKYEKKIAKLQEEIERLKEELESKNNKAKKPAKSDGSEEEARLWKARFEELQEAMDGMEKRYGTLEDKVRLLLEKLKEYGGDKAVSSVLNAIGLDPPPPKSKKEQVWERLYNDAMRRVEIMRARQQKLKDEAERHMRRLKNALAGIDRSAVKKQVDKLTDLHKAHEETGVRYYDALAQITEQNAELLNGVEPGTSDGEGEAFERCGQCGQRVRRRASPSPSTVLRSIDQPHSLHQRPRADSLQGDSAAFENWQSNELEGFGSIGSLGSSCLQSRRLMPKRTTSMGDTLGDGFEWHAASSSDLEVRGVSPSRMLQGSGFISSSRSGSPSARDASQVRTRSTSQDVSQQKRSIRQQRSSSPQRSRSPGFAPQTHAADGLLARDFSPPPLMQQALVPRTKKQLVEEPSQIKNKVLTSEGEEMDKAEWWPSTTPTLEKELPWRRPTRNQPHMTWTALPDSSVDLPPPMVRRAPSAGALEPIARSRSRAESPAIVERRTGSAARMRQVLPEHSLNSSLMVDTGQPSTAYLPNQPLKDKRGVPALNGGLGVGSALAAARSVPSLNSPAGQPKRRRDPSQTTATAASSRSESAVLQSRFYITPVSSQQALAAGIAPPKADEMLRRPVTR